jgi:hypothetical protein
MTPRPLSRHALTDISPIRGREGCSGQNSTKERRPVPENAAMPRPFCFVADARAVASVRELTESLGFAHTGANKGKDASCWSACGP